MGRCPKPRPLFEKRGAKTFNSMPFSANTPHDGFLSRFIYTFLKKVEPKTFNVDRVWFNTALDGLFCKMGKTTINFVGTGVLDGPSKPKNF